MVSQDPYANLCWAAVALSVDRFRDSSSTLRICDVVMKSPPAAGTSGGAGRPDCCQGGNLSSADCDHVAILMPALQAIGRAPKGVLSGGAPDPTDPESVTAAWECIKAEISRGKVVCVGIDWEF